MPSMEKIINNSKFFDPVWYKNELSKRGICNKDKRREYLLSHYLKTGWKIGINPSSEFDGERYLKDYPDIKVAGMNPLLHYELYGKKEGRMCCSCLEFPCEVGDIYLDKFGLHILLISPTEEIPKIVFPGKNAAVKRIQLSEDQKKFNAYLQKKKGGRELTHFLVMDIFKFIPFKIISQSGKKASLSSFNIFSIRDSKYFFNRDTATPLSRFTSFKYLLLDKNINFLFKLLLIKKNFYKTKSTKILFTESLNNSNDNSYSLFLYCLKNKILDRDVFFITTKNVIDSIKNPKVKSHLIERGSLSHLKALLDAKKIVASYSFDGFQPAIDKYLSLLIHPKLIFVPHGISFDKDSFYLNDIFLGHPDCTCCCSPLEKIFFSKSCGLSNIRITGYPRMDKWFSEEINKTNNSVFLFFTWRNSITTEFEERFSLLVKALSPKKKIFIGIHSNQSPKFHSFLNSIKVENNLDFEIITPEEREKFNKAFFNCSTLITDYSSVAYDFMYGNNKKVFYYTPLADSHAEYKTLPIWKEKCLGKDVKDLNELLSEIDLPCEDKYKQRRLDFFKWIDSNNNQRVIQTILTL